MQIKNVSRVNHIFNSQLSERELLYMHTLTDDMTDKMPAGFLLYSGSYVSVTKNLRVRYNLADDTRVKIVDWQFSEGTIYKKTTYKGILVVEPYIDN